MIYINPPPQDRKCECCGRHVSDCPELLNGERGLVKDFRSNGGCIGAVWVCRLCLSLPDRTFWKLYATPKTVDLGEFLRRRKLTYETVSLRHLRLYRRECANHQAL